MNDDTYGIAWDNAGDDPNPHALTLYPERYASEQEASEVAEAHIRDLAEQGYGDDDVPRYAIVRLLQPPPLATPRQTLARKLREHGRAIAGVKDELWALAGAGDPEEPYYVPSDDDPCGCAVLQLERALDEIDGALRWLEPEAD